MIAYVVNTNDYADYTGSNDPIFPLSTDDTLTVEQGYTISTSIGSVTPVFTAGNNVFISVSGTVSSSNASVALRIGNSESSSNTVEVNATGSILSSDRGIYLEGSQSSIVNRGVIDGDFSGIDKASGSGTGVFSITNAANAVISGEYSSGINIGTTTEKTKVVNNGLIEGENSFYAAYTAGAVRIENKGTMTGEIQFGSGNDVYLGANGHFQ